VNQRFSDLWIIQQYRKNEAEKNKTGVSAYWLDHKNTRTILTSRTMIELVR